MCAFAAALIYDIMIYVVIEIELLRKILKIKISTQFSTYVDKIRKVCDTH